MELALGDGIRIREFRPEDKAALLKHADNENVARTLEDRFPHPYTEVKAEEWLSYVAEQDPVTHFAIAGDDEVIGGIGFQMLGDVYRRTAEIGYWLGEDYWGQGIATRAVRALVLWMFGSQSVERIQARVFATNPASCRVLEKAGFTCEGRLRDSVLKMNLIMDQLVFAILRHETSST